VKRVAIIGGGLAGLTCAFALKRRGIESTVFELRSTLGGRDAAALFLLSPELFRNTFELIREIGLADELVSIPPHAGQVFKGRVYHHRVASATGLLSFKGLRLTDKALLPRMAYLLTRYSSHLDFHRPALGLQFDNETVASFVKRELSQNILNYVAGPLISTLFFYGSEETSNWLYLVLAKHMYNTRMSALKGGMGRIAARISDGLEVRRSEAIEGVSADDAGYDVNGGRFSELVVAVPGDAVLAIRGMAALIEQADREFFKDCRYQRVTSVTAATEKPVDGKCYAVSIPRVEGFAAATVSFHDYIDPSTSNGRGLLTIAGGGGQVTPDRLLDELRRLYPVDPQSVSAAEWSPGMPKFPPGRYDQIQKFQERTRRRGLFFCGDYLMGPFIEAAVTTGLRAAEAIA
jgi:protoporphyrinogen/coproporphyrinogen III oxidase